MDTTENEQLQRSAYEVKREKTLTYYSQPRKLFMCSRCDSPFRALEAVGKGRVRYFRASARRLNESAYLLVLIAERVIVPDDASRLGCEFVRLAGLRAQLVATHGADSRMTPRRRRHTSTKLCYNLMLTGKTSIFDRSDMKLEKTRIATRFSTHSRSRNQTRWT